MNIALLEDEVEQARRLSDLLVAHQHHCDFFHTAQPFLHAITHQKYELYIMDWQLPETSGLTVLKEIRQSLHISVPVLFLTQRDSEEDIVTALQAGADDYLTKPAREAEMMARLNALVRRSAPPEKSETEVQFGPFLVSHPLRTIEFKGNAISLTDKDFDLAIFMFQNMGKLLSRQLLLERVWGVTTDLNTRTVDTHISRLRRKLGLNPDNGFRIKTIYQHGYRLEAVDTY